MKRFAFRSAPAVDHTLRMAAAPQQAAAKHEDIAIKAGPRLRTALLLAIAADVFQLAIFPFFIEGAASPADDLVDLCIAGVLTSLLGWHWEFLPSFAGELIPGVDMMPLWTLAVANIWRKSRRQVVAIEADKEPRPAGNKAP
jgi:hypothetical protein